MDYRPSPPLPSSIARWLAILLVFCGVIPALAAEGRVALIIGNAAYTQKPLKNPVNDAEDLADTLKGLGFEVLLRKNRSEEQMKQDLVDFQDRLERNKGVGLFYFSGHGMQAGRGRNFLLPVGREYKRERDVETFGVDAGMVLARMEEAGSTLNIVILDACRNNPFGRSWRPGVIDTRVRDRGLRWKAIFGGLAVLVISMHDESLYAERVLRAGARGYLLKGATPEEVERVTGVPGERWRQASGGFEMQLDVTDAAEAWSAVSYHGVSPQNLSGGDIYAGDVGVSGQSAATGSVRQEIDGKEGLRFNVDTEATGVTVNLSRFFINDDGSLYAESGRLRLLDDAGQVVAETTFAASSTAGTHQVSLQSAAGFSSVELVAGAYDGTDFVFGAYEDGSGHFGAPVATDTAGKQHGSDFMVDWVEFQFPILGVPLPPNEL